MEISSFIYFNNAIGDNSRVILDLENIYYCREVPVIAIGQGDPYISLHNKRGSEYKIHFANDQEMHSSFLKILDYATFSKLIDINLSSGSGSGIFEYKAILNKEQVFIMRQKDIKSIYVVFKNGDDKVFRLGSADAVDDFFKRFMGE